MPITPTAQPDVERTQILLVHPDDATRRSLQLLLNGWGFEVRAFTSTPALTDPCAIGADVLLLDDQMPTREAGAMLAGLRRNGWRGRAILMTHSPDETLNNMATVAGFAAIVRNPPREVELLGALGR